MIDIFIMALAPGVKKIFEGHTKIYRKELAGLEERLKERSEK